MSRFWNFKAKNDTEGELMLYGPISSTTWWGDEVTPKQFKSDLDALGDIASLSIYINSDGGDVFAGQAIYSMLKRHKANKTVYIDGLAASIASLIAMAGDTVYMPSNAMLMVHHPYTLAMGNANEFRKLAEDLDKIGESMLATYAAKTGLEHDRLLELLDAETWLNAEDAFILGFADEIEEQKTIAASIEGGFLVVNDVTMDLSRYKNAPTIEAIEATASEPQPEDVQPLVDLYQEAVRINQRRVSAWN